LSEQYIDEIVSYLPLNEIIVLSILHDNEIDAPHKAMKKNDLMQRSKLTESNFRKVIYRLTALRFVLSYTESKEHAYYITKYGSYAITKKLEKEE
jgi:predicted transcriptional regulator